MTRIKEFDTARAVCMLYIVGFWHIRGRVIGLQSTKLDELYWITVMALSAFTFISGFCVVRSFKGSIKEFYIHRIQRFYPLYIIACVTMFIARIISGNPDLMDFKQFMLSIVGLSIFLGNSPITLWYMAMLMFFYGVTPFLSNKNIFTRTTVFILIWVFLFLGCNYFSFDMRLLIFFPIYYVGVLVGIRKDISYVYSPIIVVLSLLCCIAFSYIYIRGFGTWVIQCCLAITSIPIVLFVCKLITGNVSYGFFKIISYASFCAYLFHNQFFGIVKGLLGIFTLPIAYLIVIPLLIIISYLLQTLYDKVITIRIKTADRKRY